MCGYGHSLVRLSSRSRHNCLFRKWKIPDSAGRGSQKCLQDVKTQETLLFTVYEWQRRGNLVYAVGRDGQDVLKYIVLDIAIGLYKCFSKISEAPLEYRIELSRLRKKRWPSPRRIAGWPRKRKKLWNGVSKLRGQENDDEGPRP